jgi:hypothetical protein
MSVRPAFSRPPKIPNTATRREACHSSPSVSNRIPVGIQENEIYSMWREKVEYLDTTRSIPILSSFDVRLNALSFRHWGISSPCPLLYTLEKEAHEPFPVDACRHAVAILA